MDKFIKRQLWSQLITSLNKDVITVLIGPRQVGKTTILFTLIDYLKENDVKKEEIYYYNFDDVELRAKIKKDFYFIEKDIEFKIGKKIQTTKNKIYLFLDEGQKVPEIFELVKIFYDKKYPIKIFITGSSSLNIKDRSAETLVGRVDYLYLSPLLFSEVIGKNLSIYNQIERLDIDLLMKKAAVGWRNIEEINLFLQKTIFFGSLPKIINYSQNDAVIYLNNFISSYLDRDIKDIGAKVNIEKFYLSFKYITDYTADLFNFSKLSADLGVKRDSLYRYFELLEKTLIINTCLPFINPSLKHIFKSRKLFIFDNGVVTRHKGYIDFQEAEKSGFIGKLFENYIFQNFYSKSLNDIKKPNYFYYRDYQNHEIDFIYKRGETIIPIETTYSKNISSDKIRNFRHFFKLQNQVEYGIIFYLGEVKKIIIDNKPIFALPYFLM